MTAILPITAEYEFSDPLDRVPEKNPWRYEMQTVDLDYLAEEALRAIQRFVEEHGGVEQALAWLEKQQKQREEARR